MRNKLYSFSVNTKSKQFKVIKKLQDKNMNLVEYLFVYRVFNQINLVSTN